VDVLEKQAQEKSGAKQSKAKKKTQAKR